MKNLRKYLCLFIFSIPVAGFSQSPDDVVEDLLVIADGFAAPAANSVAYEANGGWFSSAQSLEPWKVEVSVHANALFVPSSRKSFTISNSDFQAINVQGSSNASIPTAFGGASDVAFEGSVLGNDFEFDAIEGVDKSFVGHPFAQVTIGLPAETEFAIRAMPKITLNDVQVSTYGAGIKHNFSQYLRYNRPEDFQFSAFVAYSLFDVEYAFDPLNLDAFGEFNAIEVDADVWVAELLGSKRYENFEIFGALGVANSDFAYMMQGSGAALSEVNSRIQELGDSQAQFKGDIGFNVYLQDFKISTMATAGKFFNLNIGLHFRI
ncbi:DUF6588 family protein [Zunongwangia sp. F363]|uniref:DUF6588 family protein n=1 Tax=Autumnicola tepida TaxID=3075595 RepID=A0ABU3C7U5_9FLAO|nr:DUF6588 family protein [Zunongwangia sp. F363]MDT0642409.1 DUF6588 family protein [Zunongwangia sp. F363]